MMNIPEPLPASGFDVPLRASFTVFRSLPLLGVSTNSASPRLTLFPDRVEYKVIARVAKRYDEIHAVDVRQTLGTQNAILFPRGGMFAFSGNLGEEMALVALLAYFERRNVPLTPRAKALRDKALSDKALH
ncbi:MAG: hypothetical protein WKG32_10170 [Gemmatimonadaceae bacterium]